MERKTKKCSGPCGQTLPLDRFYWNNREQRCKVGKCKQCWSAYVRERRANLNKRQRLHIRKKNTEWAHRDRTKNPEKWWLRRTKADLQKKFGVTYEWFEAKLKEQKNACAICGGINRNGRRLSVDHHHQSNQVRGLLCHHCNIALERLEAVLEWHLKALRYLDFYKVRTTNP